MAHHDLGSFLPLGVRGDHFSLVLAVEHMVRTVMGAKPSLSLHSAGDSTA